MLTFLFYRLFQYADLPKRSLIKFMRIFLNYFHMGKFILTENFCQVRTVKKLVLFNKKGKKSQMPKIDTWDFDSFIIDLTVRSRLSHRR